MGSVTGGQQRGRTERAVRGPWGQASGLLEFVPTAGGLAVLLRWGFWPAVVLRTTSSQDERAAWVWLKLPSLRRWLRNQERLRKRGRVIEQASAWGRDVGGAIKHFSEIHPLIHRPPPPYQSSLKRAARSGTAAACAYYHCHHQRWDAAANIRSTTHFAAAKHKPLLLSPFLSVPWTLSRATSSKLGLLVVVVFLTLPGLAQKPAAMLYAVYPGLVPPETDGCFAGPPLYQHRACSQLHSFRQGAFCPHTDCWRRTKRIAAPLS